MNTFKIGKQILVNKDSLVYLKNKRLDRTFDVCITDPPYNISGSNGRKKIGWIKSNKVWKEEKKFNRINEKWDIFSSEEEYKQFTEKWLRLIFKKVKVNGNLLIFGSYHNIFTIGDLLKSLNKRIINSIVWYKRNAFPNITQRMLCESTEYIIWAVNNDPKKAKNWTFNYETLKEINGGKQMRNVWDIPNSWKKSEIEYGKHPAQKPEVLMKRLILGFTKKGDYILDPFAGSGSLLVTAMQSDRKSLGVEVSEKYLNIAKKRLQGLHSQGNLMFETP